MKITATTKLHGVELGEELASAMSQAIADEIDWGIMCDLMKSIGWTEVKMSWDGRLHPRQAYEIKEWCKDTLQGHYKCRFDTWIFERSEDAMWFALKWSS